MKRQRVKDVEIEREGSLRSIRREGEYRLRREENLIK